MNPNFIFCLLQLSHEGKCEYMIIPCPSCKEQIRFNEQERHNERECPERTLNCKYCKEPFHFKNIKVRNNAGSERTSICLLVVNSLKWLVYDRVKIARSCSLNLCKKLYKNTSFLGPRRDLPQVPHDLWRLCQEENPQGEGEFLNLQHTQYSRFYIVIGNLWLNAFGKCMTEKEAQYWEKNNPHYFKKEDVWNGCRTCQIIVFFSSLAFSPKYVDHIKFCSKFRTPCRFHVVGCDMSVSSFLIFSELWF